MLAERAPKDPPVAWRARRLDIRTGTVCAAARWLSTAPEARLSPRVARRRKLSSFALNQFYCVGHMRARTLSGARFYVLRKNARPYQFRQVVRAREMELIKL